MHLNELKALHVSEVLKQAEALEIENVGRMRKQELMFAIIKKRAKAGEHLDLAIEEFRAMKMQPYLERALRHKGLLHA